MVSPTFRVPVAPLVPEITAVKTSLPAVPLTCSPMVEVRLKLWPVDDEPVWITVAIELFRVDGTIAVVSDASVVMPARKVLAARLAPVPV